MILFKTANSPRDISFYNLNFRRFFGGTKSKWRRESSSFLPKKQVQSFAFSFFLFSSFSQLEDTPTPMSTEFLALFKLSSLQTLLSRRYICNQICQPKFYGYCIGKARAFQSTNIKSMNCTPT